MGINIEYFEGQPPIDEDEKHGLKIKTISTIQELDEFEQNNIEKAVQWTLSRKHKPNIIFSENFIKKLHKQMFGDVWNWAGSFRNSNKNIGVDKFQIAIELRNLIDDANYWMEYKTYEEDELAIRFKHKLVSIHLFPNGNGRHSRLMADVIISHLFNKPVFTWGNIVNIARSGKVRSLYIKSLQDADLGNHKSLIQFARS